MSYEEVTKVWMSGKLVDFADAKIHAFSHVFHYGSGIFEGARVPDGQDGILRGTWESATHGRPA